MVEDNCERSYYNHGDHFFPSCDSAHRHQSCRSLAGLCKSIPTILKHFLYNQRKVRLDQRVSLLLRSLLVDTCQTLPCVLACESATSVGNLFQCITIYTIMPLKHFSPRIFFCFVLFCYSFKPEIKGFLLLWWWWGAVMSFTMSHL